MEVRGGQNVHRKLESLPEGNGVALRIVIWQKKGRAEKKIQLFPGDDEEKEKRTKIGQFDLAPLAIEL